MLKIITYITLSFLLFSCTKSAEDKSQLVAKNNKKIKYCQEEQELCNHNFDELSVTLKAAKNILFCKEITYFKSSFNESLDLDKQLTVQSRGASGAIKENAHPSNFILAILDNKIITIYLEDIFNHNVHSCPSLPTEYNKINEQFYLENKNKLDSKYIYNMKSELDKYIVISSSVFDFSSEKLQDKNEKANRIAAAFAPSQSTDLCSKITYTQYEEIRKSVVVYFLTSCLNL